MGDLKKMGERQLENQLKAQKEKGQEKSEYSKKLQAELDRRKK